MSHRMTISLDQDAFGFLVTEAGKNRSKFINDLLLSERQRILKEQIYAANLEEAEDVEYQAELTDWEITAEDGL